MKGYMYILLCGNGNYYTGSTIDLERRLQQHQRGEGANFTKKHLPVKLMYFEEFERIDEAFYREKQVQGWSRAKKEALINGEKNKLHELSECKNNTRFDYPSTGSGTASTGSGTASTGSGTASTGSGIASTGSGIASTTLRDSSKTDGQ